MIVVDYNNINNYPLLSEIGCRLKKPSLGKELNSVWEYIEKGFPKVEGCDLCVFIEPSISYCYPDIVLVYLNRKKYKKWSKRREKLSYSHLHFIADLSLKRVFRFTDIFREFKRNWRRSWFKTRKSLIKSIGFLEDLDIIQSFDKNYVKIDVDGNFAADKIIVIEAKRHKWKKGLQQSLMHTSYASESYLWMINKVYKQKELEKSVKKYNVGLIMENEEYDQPTIQAPKFMIPNGTASWLLNHWSWILLRK